jgi:hypothetical protein
MAKQFVITKRGVVKKGADRNCTRKRVKIGGEGLCHKCGYIEIIAHIVPSL